MAGKMCPNPDCGQLTFHRTPTGRKCSKCETEMTTPPNNGKGGKGRVCPNCEKHTLFNNNCRNSSCGAKVTIRKKISAN